jgi:hypothetical protein
VKALNPGCRPLAALIAILMLAACAKKGDEPSTSGMAPSKEPPPMVVPAPPANAAPETLPLDPGASPTGSESAVSKTKSAGALEPAVRPPPPEKTGPEPEKPGSPQ